MKLASLISSRIVFGMNRGGRISGPIVGIAIAGVALGTAVMIIALAILTGFRNEIQDKVTGFGAHIQISHFDENESFESKAVSMQQDFYRTLNAMPGVRHIQVYALKAGIIKTHDDMEGLVLKGIGQDFDWGFFNKKIIQGSAFSSGDSTKSNSILLSAYTATRLKLGPGDSLIMYFIQQPPRMRKFVVSGIYETGLEEFDKLYALCDIRHIQKLNDWKADEVAGFEVLVDNFDQLDQIGRKVYERISYELDARTIRELYPQLFDWLDLQDMNALIIIVLMLLVAGINMISALLIIILERSSMIGILKAIGASNGSIRRIFLYTGAWLTGTGILAGNILGIGLCLLQRYFHLIKLPQESYYVSVMPVNISLSHILLLNAGTLIACTAMLILPTLIIARISPVKAIRFQ